MRLAVQNEYTKPIWRTLGVHRLRFPAALFGGPGNGDPKLLSDELLSGMRAPLYQFEPTM
jgi:hypothetical protein